MIPIVMLNNEGKVVGQQAYNDNLTVVEEINRIMLATLFCGQQRLTNDKHALDQIIMKGEYDAAQLAALKTAVETLHKSVSEALATFEIAIAQ